MGNKNANPVPKLTKVEKKDLRRRLSIIMSFPEWEFNEQLSDEARAIGILLEGRRPVERKVSGIRYDSYSQELRDTIVAGYLGGKTMVALAEEYGITYGIMDTIITKSGVKKSTADVMRELNAKRFRAKNGTYSTKKEAQEALERQVLDSFLKDKTPLNILEDRYPEISVKSLLRRKQINPYKNDR